MVLVLKKKQNKMGSTRTDLGMHVPSTSVWSVSRLTQSGRRTARSQPARFDVSPSPAGPGGDLSRPGAPLPTKRTQGPRQMEPQVHRNSPREGEPHRHRPTSTHTHPSLTHCLWVTLGDSFLIMAAAEGWAGHAHEGLARASRALPPGTATQQRVLLRGRPA